MGLRNIDKLNALTAPLYYGDCVILNDVAWTVDKNLSCDWFLRDSIGRRCCFATTMVGFIAEIVYEKERI
jgi:hypothetical protein